MLKTDVSGNAKSSTTTGGCETKDEGPLLVGYARQKTKAHGGWEAKDESPPLEQPKSSLSGGDYVMIVEEVKSTIQARYTTTYIQVYDVCVEQTYDAIWVSMSHDDVGRWVSMSQHAS